MIIFVRYNLSKNVNEIIKFIINSPMTVDNSISFIEWIMKIWKKEI